MIHRYFPFEVSECSLLTQLTYLLQNTSHKSHHLGDGGDRSAQQRPDSDLPVCGEDDGQDEGPGDGIVDEGELKEVSLGTFLVRQLRQKVSMKS